MGWSITFLSVLEVRLLGGDLGLDDGLDVVLPLVDDRLHVMLVLDLHRVLHHHVLGQLGLVDDTLGGHALDRLQAGGKRRPLDDGRVHDILVLLDDGPLGGGLGLDDGLDAVLPLVDDGLHVMLASHLDRALVERSGARAWARVKMPSGPRARRPRDRQAARRAPAREPASRSYPAPKENAAAFY
jgi:hypothetical protein